MDEKTEEAPVCGHLLGDVVSKGPHNSSFFKQEEEERHYDLWNLQRRRQSNSENADVLIRKKTGLPHGLRDKSW